MEKSRGITKSNSNEEIDSTFPYAGMPMSLSQAEVNSILNDSRICTNVTSNRLGDLVKSTNEEEVPSPNPRCSPCVFEPAVCEGQSVQGLLGTTGSGLHDFENLEKFLDEYADGMETPPVFSIGTNKSFDKSLYWDSAGLRGRTWSTPKGLGFSMHKALSDSDLTLFKDRILEQSNLNDCNQTNRSDISANHTSMAGTSDRLNISIVKGDTLEKSVVRVLREVEGLKKMNIDIVNENCGLREEVRLLRSDISFENKELPQERSILCEVTNELKLIMQDRGDVNGMIKEIRELKESMSSCISSIKEDLSVMKADITGIKAGKDSMDQQATSMGNSAERIATLSGDLSSIRTEILTMKSNIADTKTLSDSINQQVSAMDTKWEQKDFKLDKKVESINEEICRTNAAGNYLMDKNEKIDVDIDKLHDKVNLVNMSMQGLKGIEDGILELKECLKRMEESQTEIDKTQGASRGSATSARNKKTRPVLLAYVDSNGGPICLGRIVKGQLKVNRIRKRSIKTTLDEVKHTLPSLKSGDCVLLHLGTNDIQEVLRVLTNNGSKINASDIAVDIVKRLKELINVFLNKDNQVKVIISTLLPRQDVPMADVIRKRVNYLIETSLAEEFKGNVSLCINDNFEIRGLLTESLYKPDKLHLNTSGIMCFETNLLLSLEKCTGLSMMVSSKYSTANSSNGDQSKGNNDQAEQVKTNYKTNLGGSDFPKSNETPGNREDFPRSNETPGNGEDYDQWFSDHYNVNNKGNNDKTNLGGNDSPKANGTHGNGENYEQWFSDNYNVNNKGQWRFGVGKNSDDM